ncbi:MAG: helix-hairpin-helix domain-containing protein [Anaerolineales bacterium]|nr:helix-hairpin-helix domain-containing protein [Anaerolineales bacterium]
MSIGIVFLLTRPPRGTPIQLKPPPTPSPYIVHISGAVAEPGVYSLIAGSRIQNAIEAAGGHLPSANLDGINMAAVVEDGDQIWVPYHELITSTPQPKEPTSNTTPQTNEENEQPPIANLLININTASISELDSLPGIGPQKASEIIAYRDGNGPFERIEEIEMVSGIGPVTFNNIKALICVSDQP